MGTQAMGKSIKGISVSRVSQGEVYIIKYCLLLEQSTPLPSPPLYKLMGFHFPATFSLDSKPKGQGNNGKSRGQRKPSKGGAKTRHWANDGGPALPYCSLCGDWSHKAASSCRNMRDDSNKIVNVMPSHTTCNLCPMFVQPRLSHPPMYCPSRPNGIFAKPN